MNTFTIIRPRTFPDAVRDFSAVADVALPQYKAGGMDVVDHLKEGIASPSHLIDIRRLQRDGARQRIHLDGNRIVIEANATLAQIAASDIVRRHALALAEACGGAATPQVRNVATLAGNLLQRPRCWYYRNEQFQCLKKGGNTCFAVEGENKFHAIFGGGPCHIVHPSNAAPPLFVFDARVHFINGEGAARDVAIAELYNEGRDWVQREHVLPSGAVITHITLATSQWSGFYAVKEKQSFDWPLAMAAASLDLDGDVIRAARVCAGAMAPWPWPLPTIEQRLAGVSVRDDAALSEACSTAADGASPMRDNGYKARLLPVVVRRAVQAAGRA